MASSKNGKVQMPTLVRQPAVAGQFYPARREALLNDISRYVGTPTEPLAALGCIVPHAGYMYSGHVAGAVYARLKLPSRYIILCPNHTGRGAALAIMSEGEWATPLGNAQIDSELATALKDTSPLLDEDSIAHRNEHALEVQLPFLQKLVGNDFRFVPITVGTGSLEALEELGNAIAEVVESTDDDVLIVASSDMNHYESDSITREKDSHAIERILTLDPAGLHQVVRRERISMCGYGPAVAMLTAARELGARKAELIRYATSGDISGERDAVVGYAGIAVM